MQAVEVGEVDEVAALLQETPGLVHARISSDLPEGDTLLHRADPLRANDGGNPDDPHLRVAQLLIDHGADVDAIGGRGEVCNTTPLDAAAWAGNAGMVELLLARGADPEKAAPGMPTPVETAASHNRKTVFLRLIEAGAPYAIGHTIQLGLVRQTRELLDAAPVLVNEPLPDGHMPLTLAVTARKRGVFGLLVRRGADLHRRAPMAIRPCWPPASKTTKRSCAAY